MIEFVKVSSLKNGDVLAKTIYNDKLQVLLKEGNRISDNAISIIKSQGYKGCYIDHGGNRREDVPISEPLIDDAALIVIVKNLKEIFANKEAFSDPVCPSFKKQREDTEWFVSELVKGIRNLYNDNKFLYETEDCTRTVKNWIYHHSINTCVISIGIAMHMGFDDETIKKIAFGALFHDFGKAYFGEELYNKPDLTDEDRNALRRHPEIAFRVFQRLNYPVDTTYAIWQHHEKVDGSGYPNGLGAQKITNAAQIVALASAFDNAVSIQAYNDSPMNQCDALEYIQGCGLFNIDCIRALFRFIVPYPIGSKVLLSNGKTGIVLKNVASTIMRPYVLVGTELYDLSSDMSKMSVTILQQLD